MGGISGLFGKIFRPIINFLKKYWKELIILIIIILIIIAIFFPYLIPIIWAYVVSAWATISSWVIAAWQWLLTAAAYLWDAAATWVAEASFSDVLKLATGAAVLFNPEGVASAIGTIIETIAEVAAPYIPWILGGFGLWFLLRRRSDDEDENKGTSS